MSVFLQDRPEALGFRVNGASIVYSIIIAHRYRSRALSQTFALFVDDEFIVNRKAIKNRA